MRKSFLAVVFGLTLLFTCSGCGEDDHTGTVVVVNSPDVIADGSKIFGNDVQVGASNVPVAVVTAENGVTIVEVVPEDEIKPSEEPKTEFSEAYVESVIADILKRGDDYSSVTDLYPMESYTFENDGVRRVCVDAGHQAIGSELDDREPARPGDDADRSHYDTYAAYRKMTNIKVAYGAEGVATGNPESELNLAIALLLEEELKSRGYEVVMVRRSEDVNISNVQRALIAAETGCDIAIHLHMDSTGDNGGKWNPEKIYGAHGEYVSKRNTATAVLSDSSYILAKYVTDAYCEATGFKRRDLQERPDTDDKTGLSALNWARVPATLFELGYLSCSEEDRKMSDPEFQKKMAKGIADGIDAYFNYMEANVGQ